MFCSECGTKNKKGDMFCQNCGAKLEEAVVEEKTTKKKAVKAAPVTTETVPITETIKEKTANSVNKIKGKINKKFIIIASIIVVIGAGLGITYKVLSDLTSPKKVVDEYFKAIEDADLDVLYDYLDLSGDTTFVSKDVFKELYEDIDPDDYEIKSYKVTGSKVDGDEATVKVTYRLKGEQEKRKEKVELVKDGSKYLIFANWKVSEGINLFSLDIAKKYTITAPKGTKIVFGGVEVTSEYLDEDESTDTQDVYVLPQVFEKSTKVVATLYDVFESERTVTPYDKGSMSVYFYSSDIKDDVKDDLEDVCKDFAQEMFNSALAGKAYSDIESSYDKASSSLSNNYTNFVSSLNSSSYSQLKSIEITSATISSVNVDEDDGNLSVSVKLNYKYTVDKSGTVKDSTDYDYVTVVLTKDKDDYKLVNISSLPTYFY